MDDQSAFAEIDAAIAAYARAYDALEEAQKKYKERMPKGDQKTGVIAEYYARRFADRRFGRGNVGFGSTSQHGWDMQVQKQGHAPLKIQVKSVSAYSKYRRLSTIHGDWSQLWLLRLDRDFRPDGFWIVKAADCSWFGTKQITRTLPRSGAPSWIPNAEDALPALQALLAADAAPRLDGCARPA
jgi:hypothetical protein